MWGTVVLAGHRRLGALGIAQILPYAERTIHQKEFHTPRDEIPS